MSKPFVGFGGTPLPYLYRPKLKIVLRKTWWGYTHETHESIKVTLAVQEVYGKLFQRPLSGPLLLCNESSITHCNASSNVLMGL